MNEEWEVSGIILRSEQEYKDALDDKRNIELITARIDLTNTRTILKLYKSLIEKGTFKTGVGFVFLRQLYDILVTGYGADNTDIPHIRFSEYADAYETGKNDVRPENVKRAGREWARKKDKLNEMLVDKYKNRIRVLGIVVALLVICVVGMFVITMKSDTMTYSNAKNSVINEYEEWRQELEAREKEIEKREDELGLK